MRGYKIRRADGQWYFELIPCNNNHQPIGKSSLFDSRKGCVDGLRCLRELIVEKRVNCIGSPYITLTHNANNYSFSYLYDSTVIYRSREYVRKQNCVKSIEMIFKYIDEYTSYELTD